MSYYFKSVQSFVLISAISNWTKQKSTNDDKQVFYPLHVIFCDEQ